MMYQMNSNLQVLGLSINWHWPHPLAKECCLNSKSNWGDQNNNPLKLSFRVFVIIMCINGQRPHKQANKIISQYGPSGQSENYININN